MVCDEPLNSSPTYSSYLLKEFYEFNPAMSDDYIKSIFDKSPSNTNTFSLFNSIQNPEI